MKKQKTWGVPTWAVKRKGGPKPKHPADKVASLLLPEDVFYPRKAAA